MKKNIVLFALAVAALMAVPTITRAQGATTNSAPDASAPVKKHHGAAIHGKVTAVDAKAMTVTVGTDTYNVTSDTKITKDGQPATFADITAGTAIHGAYKKDGDKMNATMIGIGKGKKKAE